MRSRGIGFSLIELMMVIAIISVLAGAMLVVIKQLRQSAEAVNCLANLRQITTAFRMYAGDNGYRLPDPQAVEVSWESMISKYVSNPGVFRCPADSELGPVAGSSFDWRDTGKPETTLAGRLMTDSQRGNCVLTFEALPGWHKKLRMNVGRLDGSCATLESSEAIADIMLPLR